MAYADWLEFTRRRFLLLTTVVAGACQEEIVPRSIRALVLLTREGCVHFGIMRERLDAALHALHWPRDYQMIDAGTLSTDDLRP